MAGQDSKDETWTYGNMIRQPIRHDSLVPLFSEAPRVLFVSLGGTSGVAKIKSLGARLDTPKVRNEREKGRRKSKSSK